MAKVGKNAEKQMENKQTLIHLTGYDLFLHMTFQGPGPSTQMWSKVSGWLLHESWDYFNVCPT